MHLEGPGPIPVDDPEAAECIWPMPTFVGANLRKQVMTGDAEAMRHSHHTPCKRLIEGPI